MEMTGVAVNQAPCSIVMKSQVVGNRIGTVSKICVKPRRELSFGFRDTGHVLYYEARTKGGVKIEKGITAVMVTEKDAKKKMKKMMKRFKGLAKDLSMLSQAELVGEADPDGISRAAETLMQHVEVMKRKEKELKKKRKVEKILMKAAKGAQCESSSSSSSESSDKECREVVDLAGLRMRASIKHEAPKESSFKAVSDMTPPIPTIPQHLENQSCKSNISNVMETVNKRIEVCMGGKCKKSGAAQLIEEFAKVVGEGAVAGCKCMGKCRDGPNVKVLSSGADAPDLGKIQVSTLRPPPLCTGVGLEDVGVIVANFLGGGGSSSSSTYGDQASLAVASAT